MPRKRTRPTESSTERGPNRPKLDGRLQFLLSLPADRLSELRRTEAQRLREVAADIRDARQTVESEESDTGKERARERLQAAERRRFAPLSTGWYVPGDRDGLPAPPARSSEPFVSAFILSDASTADLADMGVEVRCRVGDVFTAFVPLSAIPRLEASAAVRYLELARPLFPALNTAVPYAQINALHNAVPPLTGAGVVVGIVDLEVLDFYHADFRTAGGATRVLSLWDQNLTAVGAEAAPVVAGVLSPFGVEYDQAAIDAELNHPVGTPAYQRVRHGGAVASHGTAVAGIAAGNGLAQGGTFVGAAPEADIIYVRLREPVGTAIFADSGDVAAAFKYIFSRAGSQPCVVNMSATDDIGPHDGMAAGEQFLDGLLEVPGRAITVAAGNSNLNASHAAGTVPPGGSTTLVLKYTGGAVHDDTAEIWYDGHDEFEVTVTAPTNPPAIVTSIGPNMTGSASLPGGGSVVVSSTQHDARNNDNVISITITRAPTDQIPVGNWTIQLTGTVVINGAFHAWVDRNNRDQSAWLAPHVQDDHCTLGTPATARRVIAVGNHDRPGPPPLPPLPPPPPLLDQLSGRGPSRDGRIEPEIAAVGTINAPRSRNMNSAFVGSLYEVKSGTSRSAPLVAGTCALLFQCRGASATWANLKQILEDTAGTTGLAIPHPGFGFGILRVANACSGAIPITDAWLRDDLTDTGIEPFTGAVAWLSPDIEILDTSAAPVANPSFHPTNRFNNIVRVTVRNRGAQPARNTEVFLYWADPATNIPYPAAWNTSGFYTGAPNFATQGHVVAIPLLQPGASTQVQFAWAPPAPGSNLRQDNHFCLLVRVENESDASEVGAGGWSAITARNNIALRNVLVQPVASGMGFLVVGTADRDSLVIRAEDAEIVLDIPVAALPWRERRLIERHGPRAPYGLRIPDPVRSVKAVLKGLEAEERADVFGATTLEVFNGIARIRATPGRKLLLRSLRLVEGAHMPARLQVQARTEAGPRFVHAAQYSGGQLVGGVSLQFGRTKEQLA
jgi:Subtilase family